MLYTENQGFQIESSSFNGIDVLEGGLFSVAVPLSGLFTGEIATKWLILRSNR